MEKQSPSSHLDPPEMCVWYVFSLLGPTLRIKKEGAVTISGETTIRRQAFGVITSTSYASSNTQVTRYSHGALVVTVSYLPCIRKPRKRTNGFDEEVKSSLAA
jgi:hypothetical protein